MDLGKWFKNLRVPRGKSPKPPENDYGLYTLVSKPGGAENCVDIVAIHGLSGHYLKTWTDEETGVNWLKDIIPAILPSARVMSFWYSSKIQSSRSTSNIMTFADQLLDGIVNVRETPNESKRPIIFICHSLGGVVFKQAFNKSQEHDKYTELAKKVRGVMFFGTPHQGSLLAPWGTIIGRLADALGKSANAQLSKELEPQSALLEHIATTFLERCKSLRIVSCYETVKMPHLHRLIVEKNSAVLGIPEEVKIPLDADHRTICKFVSITSKQFLFVRKSLEDITRSSELQGSPEAISKLIRSLAVADYSMHKALIPKPVEGTCKWILSHQLYSQWEEGVGQSLLWLSADAGCGKSVLSSYLIDHLFETQKMKVEIINVCYFFFKSDNLEQLSVVSGLKSLLHQLYSQQESLAHMGIPLLQATKVENVDKYWKNFVSSVESDLCHPTFCILDGIDECQKDTRDHFLSLISAYFSDRKPGKETVRLRMLIASRPDVRIKLALDASTRQAAAGRSSDNPVKISSDNGIGGVSDKIFSESSDAHLRIIRLRGEDEIEAISDDISRVVDYKISVLIRQGLPERILGRFRQSLIARADRTFLWVSLIIHLLEIKIASGASPRELDELLKNTDIYKIYGELLASNTDYAKASKLLQIVLAATRPLTIEEISIALAIAPESGRSSEDAATFDAIEYDLVYPAEIHIKSLCGHFLRIIRNKVYFVHETAREFLISQPPGPAGLTALNTDPLQIMNWSSQVSFQHKFNLHECYTLLLGICSTYLYCLGRKSTCAGLGQPSDNTAAFLLYASTSWVQHYHQVLYEDPSLDTTYYKNLCHPLFPGFQAWIKAYWFPNPPDHPIGLSQDETQDFYVRHFQLDEEHDHLYLSLRGDEYWKKKLSNASSSLSLSTNPDALRNHGFPLQVDGRGFVSFRNAALE